MTQEREMEMGKRNTKADRILNNSAMRLEAAIIREQLAQSQLNTAKALREAAEEAHNALTAELAPTPRNASTKKAAASAPAQSDSPADKKDSGAPCIANVPTLNVPCGEREDRPIHDPNGGYAGYHPFETPKPVARAPRKSKAKPGETSSVPSSEIAPAAAGNVAHAASAGD